MAKRFVRTAKSTNAKVIIVHQMDCIRIVQKYCMDICHMKVRTTGSKLKQISSHFKGTCLFIMVLISESHVFISWMHVFWNADTGFGTNPNIKTKNGGILNPKSLHISRNVCQLLENIPLMFTRCLLLLHANSSLWEYAEWF